MEEKNVLEGLTRYRTSYLMGEIKHGSSQRCIEQMLEFQYESHNQPINLLINSQGGSIGAALEICDFIDHILTAPVHATVFGECSSAATFILLHCPVRRATPHARFIIHSGRLSGMTLKIDSMTQKNLELLLKESTELSELVVNMYVERLDMTKARVQELIDRGDSDFNFAITAAEANAIGLITEIISEGKSPIFGSIRS